MPMYDYECSTCKLKKINELRKISEKEIPCTCGAMMVRVWSTTAHVLGDEIDVEIKHGLCNADGTPRRWRSREALNKAAEQRGLTNFVEHKPAPGTDKSKHTMNWAAGLPPGVDGRPMSMLSPDEQAARHKEWEALG